MQKVALPLSKKRLKRENEVSKDHDKIFPDLNFYVFFSEHCFVSVKFDSV